MKLKKYAHTDIELSNLCLGTMNFASRCDYSESEKIVREAWELGINFIDSAAMYSQGESEKFLGDAMKALPREKLFLVTKVVKGIDCESIVSSLEESLTRLKTDYVDLYLIHWPVEGMSLTEMMRGLNETIKSGKTKFIGVCNFPAYLLAAANQIAIQNSWEKLSCNQVAYNLIERGVEVEILPQAMLEKIAIMAYRPLSMGLLTGNLRHGSPLDPKRRGATDARVITWLSQHGDHIEQFIKMAENLNVSPVQLAGAWVCHSPAVTAPIIGVSSVEQLISTVKIDEFELSDDDYQLLNSIFDTEVKEESLQKFPGITYNFPRLRRNLTLSQK